MPQELALALSALFVLATWLSATELRAATEPPVCSACPHCRRRALDRRREELRTREDRIRRTWGLDDRDDEGRHRP